MEYYSTKEVLLKYLLEETIPTVEELLENEDQHNLKAMAKRYKVVISNDRNSNKKKWLHEFWNGQPSHENAADWNLDGGIQANSYTQGTWKGIS